MKRLLVVVAAVTVAVCTAAGCSGSSGSARPAATSPETDAPQPAMSAKELTGVVATRLSAIRPVLAEEHRDCGGTATIEQRNIALAARCKRALADLAALAKTLVFTLAHVQPPLELQDLVARTADAAGPIPVVNRSYPRADCLPSPGTGDPRAGRCNTAGREFALLIAQFESVLPDWEHPAPSS